MIYDFEVRRKKLQFSELIEGIPWFFETVAILINPELLGLGIDGGCVLRGEDLSSRWGLAVFRGDWCVDESNLLTSNVCKDWSFLGGRCKREREDLSIATEGHYSILSLGIARGEFRIMYRQGSISNHQAA